MHSITFVPVCCIIWLTVSFLSLHNPHLLFFCVLFFFFLQILFHWSLNNNKILRSPGLFWILWPISTMLWFAWSRFYLWFPNPSVFFQAFGGLYKCTKQNWYHRYLHITQLFFIFPLWSAGKTKCTRWQHLLLLLLIIIIGVVVVVVCNFHSWISFCYFRYGFLKEIMNKYEVSFIHNWIIKMNIPWVISFVPELYELSRNSIFYHVADIKLWPTIC